MTVVTHSSSFRNIILATAVETAGEAEINRTMAEYGKNRYEACAMLVNSLATIIAEDVINEDRQWAPRLDEYVYMTRQLDAAVAALTVPGLAEHTAAAQEKIIEASR